MPNWYSLKTSSGKPMPLVLAHEGLHYLHQQYSGCNFQMRNIGCKFCGTGKKWLASSPEEIAETALAAHRENRNYQVCLGGGTRMGPGRGTEFFLNCVKQIRKKDKTIPIWIEMAPPDDNKYLEQLIDAEASAFGFNLEIWDDQIRQQVCPGKSNISKQRYFEAWQYVQKRLGRDKVNTVLIVGLEPTKSTLKGIREISKTRVRITLLPFKPWDPSEFSDREPADAENLYSLAFTLAEDMAKYDISPEKNYGCANCDSCTLEEDIRKYLFSN